MKVTVLDDYQRAFDGSPAIARLRQKADVKILNYMEGKLTRAVNPEALDKRNKRRAAL